MQTSLLVHCLVACHLLLMSSSRPCCRLLSSGLALSRGGVSAKRGARKPRSWAAPRPPCAAAGWVFDRAQRPPQPRCCCGSAVGLRMQVSQKDVLAAVCAQANWQAAQTMKARSHSTPVDASQRSLGRRSCSAAPSLRRCRRRFQSGYSRALLRSADHRSDERTC